MKLLVNWTRSFTWETFFPRVKNSVLQVPAGNLDVSTKVCQTDAFFIRSELCPAISTGHKRKNKIAWRRITGYCSGFASSGTASAFIGLLLGKPKLGLLAPFMSSVLSSSTISFNTEVLFSEILP